MNDEFVGRLIGFKNEDTWIERTNVLLEVTEVQGQDVEVAFTLPPVIKGEPRLYVSIPFDELVRRVAEFHQDKKK